jgi:hypothetical protein
MVQCYSRLKQAQIERLGPDTLSAVALAEDSFCGARIELTVKLPELNVTRVEWTVSRCLLDGGPELDEVFGKLQNVRVGPGMTKIVGGLLAGQGGCQRLAELTLEAMDAVILAFTKGQIKASAQTVDPAGGELNLSPHLMGEEHIRMMAESNPRLKNSCVAFLGLD